MKFLRRFWHYFIRDLALGRKFMVINLLALSVTLVMSVLILYHIRRTILEDSMSSGEALVTQTASSLEACISTVMKTSDGVTSLQFLNRMAYSTDPEAFLKGEEQARSAEDFLAYIHSAVDHRMILDICIYLAPQFQEACTLYEKEKVFFPISRIKRGYWHGIFNGKPEAAELMCPDFYLTGMERREHGELAYIRKFLPDAGGSGEPAAYIAVYFSKEYLENILKENRAGNESVSYLINSRENIAASSDAAMTAIYYLPYDNIPDTIDGISFAQANVLGQDLYMAYRDIESTDWRLVCAIPQNSIYSKGRLFTRLAGIYVGVVLLSLILQLVLSGSLSSRIVGITEQIRQQKTITSGDAPEDRDEIGQLVITYNSMLDRIRRLGIEQTRTAEKLKVSEVKALQAQINPHFLYNMLDMINWLAIEGNKEGVSEAVRALSRFYKLTLSQKDIMIPLGEELQHAELYVKLQNMRFEEKIHFLVDVPDELYDCLIPKLVLQPVVENAILHGIFEKAGKEGNIVITGWEENAEDGTGTDVVLTVSDDGVGIPEEKLPSVLTGQSGGRGNNIAIYNTHHRLKLLYGSDYGLSFSSVYGEGTEVQIRIKRTQPDG